MRYKFNNILNLTSTFYYKYKKVYNNVTLQVFKIIKKNT